MKCQDARFAMAADPSHPGDDITQHLGTCTSCAAYAQDMLALDDKLRQAMNVPVPEIPLPQESRPIAAAPRPRFFQPRFALAASLAALTLIVGTLWIGVPRQSLASAVVGHMAHETNAWAQTKALTADAVASVLADSGVALRSELPGVTYASSCEFRGHHVPHLVVETADGPVTVMVLPEEKIAGRVTFNEGGYRGALVPAQRGSIAVLTRKSIDVDAVVSQTLAAIVYRN